MLFIGEAETNNRFLVTHGGSEITLIFDMYYCHEMERGHVQQGLGGRVLITIGNSGMWS